MLLRTRRRRGLKEERAFIEFYKQAADLFSGEDATSEANKCRLKVRPIAWLECPTRIACECTTDQSALY